jgi:hypothetical protein
LLGVGLVVPLCVHPRLSAAFEWVRNFHGF